MRVDIGRGRVVLVSWRHYRTGVLGVDGGPKVNGVTVCLIKVVFNNLCGSVIEPLVVQGYAACSVQDNYNKEIGRKISLERALSELGIQYPPTNTKACRRLVWREYFLRGREALKDSKCEPVATGG